MLNVLFVILGAIIGSLVGYLIMRPKLKHIQSINQHISTMNTQMEQKQKQLIEENQILRDKKEDIVSNISELQQQKEDILKSIKEIQEQAKNSADTLYQESYNLANEKMNNAAEKMSQKYQEASKIAEKNYLDTLQECVNSFELEISSKQIELKTVEDRITELNQKFSAAVEANKRQEEMDNKQDFYRLNLSAIDIEEIKKLREVTPYLRNSEPLNKVIWKVYYENPYTDLIGRVVGSGVHTGIYKITNIQNKMCYVGQAVNIGR